MSRSSQPASAADELVVDTRDPSADSCAAQTNRAVDALAAGASFVLVADHDPIGLRYMLEAERPGVTQWQSLEEGPTTWRARISKVAAAAR